MSPRGKTLSRRQRNAAITGIAGLATATLIAIWALGDTEDAIPPISGAAVGEPKLQIKASRDMGSLIPTGATFEHWCGTIGTKPAPIHCWDFQESAGNFADSGATGGWTMELYGATRQNIIPYIPTIDGTSLLPELLIERGFGADSIGGTKTTSDVTTTTNLHTFTVVASYPPVRLPAWNSQFVMDHYSSVTLTGMQISIGHAQDRYAVWVKGPTGNKYLYSKLNSGIIDGAIHCTTFVANGTAANAGRIYMDGADITDYSYANLDSTGTWDATMPLYFQRRANIVFQAGGLGIRLRHDATALDIDDHREVCGTLYDAPDEGETQILANDDVWTDIGAARCFDVGSHRAFCAPGDGVAMAYDASKIAVGWPVEPARTNRVLWGIGLSCTKWTCTGAASVAIETIAPDGNATASDLTVASGSDYIGTTAAGYTADATQYLSMWLKCDTSNTYSITADATAVYGDWDVDCNCLGTDWAYIDQFNSCVTVNTQFVSDSGGNAAISFGGNGSAFSGEVWGVTLTETRGISIIPTFATAQTAAASNWYIDNTGELYYTAGDSVDTYMTELSGTCWYVDGTKLRLSGAVGSECLGIWHCLSIGGGSCP